MSAFEVDDAMLALGRVWTQQINSIKGDAWTPTDKVVEELRATRYVVSLVGVVIQFGYVFWVPT